MAAKAALILGGAGFIATHLARHLVETGDFNRIVSLDIARPARPIHRVMYHTHDVREPLHKTVDGRFDVVFNLAAVHRTPGHEDYEYYETNVAGATNAAAFCERNDIQNLFFTSSIAVYGPSESPLDESSPTRPTSAYGHSKKLAEGIHTAWFEREAGRRLRIVRPAVVFGEGEGGNYTKLARLLERGIFIYPGRKNTLKAGGYVKELVRSMRFALGRPEPYYLYNFADRHCPTSQEICEAFLAHGGFRPPLGMLPLPIINAGALTFEVLNALGLKNDISRNRVSKLIHSTNIVPRRLIDDHFSYGFNLSSAIGDWLANDPEVRPAASEVHPLVLPPEPAVAPAPAEPMALRRQAGR